jgi:5-methylcytosine-specific restriction endonuclease McrA
MDTPDWAPSRDHIKPAHHGGSLEDPTYRVVVCRRCNQDKGSRSLRRFLRWLARAGDPRASRVASFMQMREGLAAAIDEELAGSDLG